LELPFDITITSKRTIIYIVYSIIKNILSIPKLISKILLKYFMTLQSYFSLATIFSA